MASAAPEPAAAAPMVPAPFRLLSKRRDTSDTWTLEMTAVNGRPLAFAPGQFTMISAAGAGEVPISISGDADRPDQLTHTVRAVGLATEALCTTEPGEVLSVRGPYGHGWPLQRCEGTDVVVAAGGLGLPPLRGAILRLLSQRERYGRVILLYGSRSPDQILFGDELEQWRARGLEVHLTVDSAGPEWLGHVGVVTRLVGRSALDGPATSVLSCGPEVMMRFLVAELLDHGVAPERTYVSLERNMQCGVAHCGHCQLGPTLVCRDGPVYPWAEIAPWLRLREL